MKIRKTGVLKISHFNVKLSLWLWLTLLGPAYLSEEGEYLPPPPYVFWVWFGLWIQFFSEMTCLVINYHVQKDS